MGIYVINAAIDILFFGFLNANCTQTSGRKNYQVSKKKFGLIFMKPIVGPGCFLLSKMSFRKPESTKAAKAAKAARSTGGL